MGRQVICSWFEDFLMALLSLPLIGTTCSTQTSFYLFLTQVRLAHVSALLVFSISLILFCLIQAFFSNKILLYLIQSWSQRAQTNTSGTRSGPKNRQQDGGLVMTYRLPGSDNIARLQGPLPHVFLRALVHGVLFGKHSSGGEYCDMREWHWHLKNMTGTRLTKRGELAG